MTSESSCTCVLPRNKATCNGFTVKMLDLPHSKVMDSENSRVFWDLERSWQIENVSKEVVPTFPGDVPFTKLQSDVWQTIMRRKASHLESETCLDRCCKIVHYHLQGKPIPRSWFSLPISGWGTSKNAGLSQLSWALTRLAAEWHDRLMPHIQHSAGAQTTLGHRIEFLPTFTAGREGNCRERDVVQAAGAWYSRDLKILCLWELQVCFPNLTQDMDFRFQFLQLRKIVGVMSFSS